MRRIVAWFGGNGRFPAAVVGAAVASLVWLVVMSFVVTSPGQARAQRATPQLPVPTAALTEKHLRQVSWFECDPGSKSVAVVAPTPPPGYRAAVTAIKTSGAKASTGTVLATVAGQPLIAVATDAALYRDLTVGAHGPDVLGFERALAAAGLIDHADNTLDAATVAAWRRIDTDGPTDRVRLASMVPVPEKSRVGDVSAAVGDVVKPGATLMQIVADGAFFDCNAPDAPAHLGVNDVIFEVGGEGVPVSSLEQSGGSGGDQNVAAASTLTIRPAAPVSDAPARVGVVSADSGSKVLAAPLSAVHVSDDGDFSVVVVKGTGTAATSTKVKVTLGVTAQGYVGITGSGLSAGTKVKLFDPKDAPKSSEQDQ